MTHEDRSGNAVEWMREHFPEFDLEKSTSDTLADLALRLPQLLPRKERKDTASFYTAPWAADLLCALAITGLEKMVCDPACGTGNLLLSALRTIKLRGKFGNNLHIFGSDINPIGAELTRIVLQTFVYENFTVKPEFKVNIIQGDAFNVTCENARGSYDIVLMNPPFSSQLRLTSSQKIALKGWVITKGLERFTDARMGLQFYFLFLADWYLKEHGTLALVIPATTFAGQAALKLLRFLQYQGYSFNCLVETASIKGAFSIDCCWKEYLVVAKKGEFMTTSHHTRLVHLEEEPSQEEVEAIAQKINSGQENLTIEGKMYGTSKLIPEEKIFSGEIMSTSIPFLTEFSLRKFSVSRDTLVPIGKSDEIGCFRGFDATYSRYLILPNEFLTHPVIEKKQNSISFDLQMNIEKTTIKSKISIPLKLLRPCLKDARTHDSIFEDTNRFWLLFIAPNTSEAILGPVSELYLRPLTGLIEESMHQKARNGGKETSKGRKKWFIHPWEYFSNDEGDVGKPGDLIGKVWTFNRYGLWRRQSIATCCQSPVTANHGCYTYYHKKSLPKDVAEKYWDLLAAWFNSTLYLIGMFEHVKIPAKHVQQVNLLEHRQMLVPKLGQILEDQDVCIKLIGAIHVLDRWLKMHPEETLPVQMQACLVNSEHPRARLDKEWMKFLRGNKNFDAQQLRTVYQNLEKLLIDF